MSAAKSPPLHILLTEDHASTRLGIRQILFEEFPHLEIGEAADAAATLRVLESGTWNLLILDISLPDRHGLDLLAEVRRRHPELHVLIYSAHAEDQFGAYALQAGAAGYLTKERAPEELCDAVRTIIAKGEYISSSLAAQFNKELLTDRYALPREMLSQRELQVLRLTAAGIAGKAIASELNLSPKTVSTYRARICRKLRFASTAEMVHYAVQHGLVKLAPR
jgi:DNA-binding NarL/FixJ family response regulator